MSMYDRVFQLRYIPTCNAHPEGSNTQFVSFSEDVVWNVKENDVEAWISDRFREDPNEFLQSETTLLVVEVSETLT